MKRHASMNRIYRLVWSHVWNAWIPVAETARGRSKGSSRKLFAASLSLFAAVGHTEPIGGQVVSGAGNIDQSGSTTIITQASQNLSLNWNSFNIAPQETVNFQQPSASAIAVNRIFDTNGTQILGHLNANGQVYLINPNGILFGQGAEVNVGGLVASTLDLNYDSLNGNARSFSGNGAGSVINKGAINAANGGYVALLGNHVSNQGVITAQMGTVALGAGSAATLTFNGNNLVHMQVDQSTLNNLAENKQLIRADGGQVIMTAGAKNALLASVVNNTGVIEARTVENHDGVITLLGGMTAGTVNVGGKLDASAPNGGNGGFIETSAAHVKVADDAKITTAAPSGNSGTWLIDPFDFTIAAIGGDITGAALTAALVGGAVTIQTAVGSATCVGVICGAGNAAGNGDIFVNDAVSWAANLFTLNAHRNININANLNASDTAGLALEFGQGAVALNNTSNIITTGAAVNLPAGTSNFTTKQGSDGAVKAYIVITSLGAEGSVTATDLQGMTGNLGINYALGGNIDASATAGWNTGAGFAPIGDLGSQFTGTFDGLGHIISGLTINRPVTDYVGLFGYVFAGPNSAIRNVGLVGGSVSGNSGVGGLVGLNNGTISNSYATGSVSGGSLIGGLVGLNLYTGTVSNSYATGKVSGNNYVGGLVGLNNGTVSNSYATGSVSGSSNIGGLVGFNSDGGTVSNVYATGSVSGNDYVGGLVGYNYGGTVSNSYATGSVSGSSNIGGLVGYNYSGGTISNGYWNSDVVALGIGGGDTNIGETGLTTAEMRTAANFAGFNFTSTPGASGNNWVMIDADGTLNNAGSAAGAVLPMLASEYSTTINNAHQLQLMAMDTGASYTLSANIDASSTATAGKDVWGSSGFVSVGNLATPFTGNFDGLDHTISHLTINLPTNDGVGLFGVADVDSAIRNVGLVGGSVTGHNIVGGLVGFNLGMVSNSFATGSVYGYGAVGGLAGYNYGTISDSYATGSIYGYGVVGGLAGGNDGAVSNSYATGSVSGGSYVGGLVGINGLLAFAYGTVSNSYATGSVSGASYVGGLIGYNFNTVSISYASGSVSGTNHVGGLMGYNYGGTISNGYWNSDVVATGIGGGDTNTGATGLTTAQMQLASNFVGFNFTTPPGAADNNWVMVDADGTLNNAGSAAGAVFPMLASEYSTTINNAHQLQLMTMDSGANYTLGANIDASSTAIAGKDVWGGSGFVSVGNATTPFTGSFDGLGHIVSDLTINQSNDNVGLFGYADVGSVIQNVGLVGVSVNGNDNVGGLVGYNYGTVSNSYATGSVTGSNNVGGLVGSNNSNISNSYATDSVSGTADNVGGLVGRNNGTVSNSYATGSVSGNYGVGGLVGYNENDTVSNSYATGSVSGNDYVGGLVGLNYGTVNNSYWNITTSGLINSDGGTGLTTVEMQSASSFVGFNFTTTPGATDNNWVMIDVDGTLNNAGSAAGASLPMLASEYSTTINNAHQLQLMVMVPGANYTLGANIDASSTGNSTDIWLSSTFVPIGNINTPFTGSFDGLGHTINGLTIDLPTNDNLIS